MPHRLQTRGLPELATPKRRRPKAAHAEGVEVRGVAAAADGLLYRAQGPDLTPGIWREDRSGDAALLAADSDEAVLVEPQAAGEWILFKRAPRSGAPSHVADIVFAREGGHSVAVPGQQVALDEGGERAVVVDGTDGKVRVLDLTDAVPAPREVFTLEGTEGQRAPPVTLSHDGKKAFVANGQHPALLELDLETGAPQRRMLPRSPGWVVAAAGEDGTLVVLSEQHTSDGPSADLVVLQGDAAPRSIFAASLSQPPVAPVVAGDVVFAALTLEPFGSATYGPVHLVALPISGGARAQGVELSAGPLRLVVRGHQLVVEGGEELLVLPLG